MFQNIENLIAGFERDLLDADSAIQDRRSRVESIVSHAEMRGDRALTAEEDDLAEKEMGEIARLQAARRRIDAKLEQARQVQAEERQSENRLSVLHNAPGARQLSDRQTATFSVTRNERTYRPDTDPNGRQFLTDVARSFAFADPAANERLAMHSREERIERPNTMRTGDGVGTGAFSGLVVPQFLIDQVAEQVSPMRPIADVVAVHHELPPYGMSVNISRITTGSSADLQGSELAQVAMQDMDDSLLTVNIQTAAGAAKVSRQALERGQGIEDVTIADIGRKMAACLDYTLIYQDVHGLDAVAHDNDFSDSTPTAAELYPYMLGAGSKLETTLLNHVGQIYLVMHPRRWNWFTAQVGSTWPFIGGNGVQAQQGGIVMANGYGQGVSGMLSNGYKIVKDASIATDIGGSQDEILVMSGMKSIHLWESAGAPVLIRAEQPAADHLAVMLVMYEYFAYTAERYANGVEKITDSGLVAPTGF